MYLSDLDYINSGLVASLVRIWKATRAKNGQFSVVSPNSMVVDVLKSAGIWKMWRVVASAEDAVHELGVSTAAQIEQRERRVLTSVAVPRAAVAVLATVLATVLMLLKRTDVKGSQRTANRPTVCRGGNRNGWHLRYEGRRFKTPTICRLGDRRNAGALNSLV